MVYVDSFVCIVSKSIQRIDRSDFFQVINLCANVYFIAQGHTIIHSMVAVVHFIPE